VLIWVPSDWVAAGLAGLAGVRVELARQRAAVLVREQAEAYLRGDELRNVVSGTY